jgi:hypothetical protein
VTPAQPNPAPPSGGPPFRGAPRPSIGASEGSSIGELFGRWALEPVERALAKERQAEHGGTAPGRRNTSANVAGVSDESRDRVAAAVGLGRTALSRALEPVERALAKERQGTRTDLQPSGKVPEGSAPQSRDRIAAAVGMKERTLARAAEVVDAATAEPVAGRRFRGFRGHQRTGVMGCGVRGKRMGYRHERGDQALYRGVPADSARVPDGRARGLSIRRRRGRAARAQKREAAVWRQDAQRGALQGPCRCRDATLPYARWPIDGAKDAGGQGPNRYGQPSPCHHTRGAPARAVSDDRRATGGVRRPPEWRQ